MEGKEKERKGGKEESLAGPPSFPRLPSPMVSMLFISLRLLVKGRQQVCGSAARTMDKIELAL